VLGLRLAAVEWRSALAFVDALALHKRSSENLQGRLAKRLIFGSAFRDVRRGEVVCKVSRVEVLALLGAVDLSVVPDVVKGEVLVDSRGSGSFQR
jgi:hypothetical protein